jgi:GDPmannose 4,6-dehydratase
MDFFPAIDLRSLNRGFQGLTEDIETMPNALITGVTGQDGSYLAEFLLEKGYKVFGVVRRSSTENFERIEHLKGRISLLQADLLDQLSLIDLVQSKSPSQTRCTTSPLNHSFPHPGQQPVLTGEFDARSA